MFMESKRFPIPNMASVEEFKVRFSAINVEKGNKRNCSGSVSLINWNGFESSEILDAIKGIYLTIYHSILLFL